MKKLLLLLPLLILAGCAKESVPAEPPETTEVNGATYELEFSGNFNSSTILHEEDWSRRDGWWIMRKDWGESKAKNGYHLWYGAFDDNLSIEDNKLKITVRVDHDKKICSGGTIFSDKIFLMKDSMWEMRFKVPKTLAGDWLTMLLQPRTKNNDYSFPVNDKITLYEITPMEGEYVQGRFRTSETIHNKDHENDPAYTGGVDYDGESVKTEYTFEYCPNWMYTQIDDDWFDTWHTLQYIWNDDEIVLFMDGKEIQRKTKPDEIKNTDGLYASFQIDASAAGECFGTVDMNMPDHYFYIDYAKVWRKTK